MPVRWTKVAFLGAAAACLAQDFLLSPALPASVASHFDAAGAPTAWMPARVFTLGYAGVVAFLVAALSAAGARVAGADDAGLNLPNKAYWLAPERRAETLAWVGGFLDLFGAWTFALLFDVFRQVVRFNAGLAPRLEHPEASLAVFMAGSLGGVIALSVRFRRPAGV